MYRSCGFSNHRHADREWARLDFIYVDPATADKLFASLRELAGPGGRAIRVPRPEHLIAMKVQALRLDLDRDFQVNREDSAAQRRLRAATPSWLELDWRDRLAMVPPDALDRRPPARDSWAPFSLG